MILSFDMDQNFIISQMGDDDIDAVLEIENESFSVPWRRVDFERFIAAPNAIFYTVKCAEDIQCCDESGKFYTVPAGTVAGYAGMYFVSPDISDDGQAIYEGMGDIVNVAVRKTLRRRGIANDLLNALITDAKKLILSTLILEVRESNVSARALYTKIGFSEVGVRKNYYSNPRENAILMNLSIDILNF